MTMTAGARRRQQFFFWSNQLASTSPSSASVDVAGGTFIPFLLFRSITLLVSLFSEGSSTIRLDRRYIANIMSYPYFPLSQYLILTLHQTYGNIYISIKHLSQLPSGKQTNPTPNIDKLRLTSLRIAPPRNPLFTYFTYTLTPVTCPASYIYISSNPLFTPPPRPASLLLPSEVSRKLSSTPELSPLQPPSQVPQTERWLLNGCGCSHGPRFREGLGDVNRRRPGGGSCWVLAMGMGRGGIVGIYISLYSSSLWHLHSETYTTTTFLIVKPNSQRLLKEGPYVYQSTSYRFSLTSELGTGNWKLETGNWLYIHPFHGLSHHPRCHPPSQPTRTAPRPTQRLHTRSAHSASRASGNPEV